MSKFTLKLIINKWLRCQKEGEYVRLKNYERKIKSQFLIYANFDSIVVPKDNEKKKNLETSRTNKYKNMLVSVIN